MSISAKKIARFICVTSLLSPLTMTEVCPADAETRDEKIFSLLLWRHVGDAVKAPRSYVKPWLHSSNATRTRFLSPRTGTSGSNTGCRPRCSRDDAPVQRFSGHLFRQERERVRGPRLRIPGKTVPPALRLVRMCWPESSHAHSRLGPLALRVCRQRAELSEGLVWTRSDRVIRVHVSGANLPLRVDDVPVRQRKARGYYRSIVKSGPGAKFNHYDEYKT